MEDKKIADEIDLFFEKSGVKLIRDVRDLVDKGNIMEFMNIVKSADFVLMLITKSFLKSENCLYEVMEFLDSKRSYDRILPIVSKDLNIYSIDLSNNFIRHWKKRAYDLKENTSEIYDSSMNSSSIRDTILHYENIYRNLSVFFDLLKKQKCWFISDQRSSKYSEIIKFLTKKTKSLESPKHQEKSDELNFKNFIGFSKIISLILNSIKKIELHILEELKSADNTNYSEIIKNFQFQIEVILEKMAQGISCRKDSTSIVFVSLFIRVDGLLGDSLLLYSKGSSSIHKEYPDKRMYYSYPVNDNSDFLEIYERIELGNSETYFFDNDLSKRNNYKDSNRKYLNHNINSSDLWNLPYNSLISIPIVDINPDLNDVSQINGILSVSSNLSNTFSTEDIVMSEIIASQMNDIIVNILKYFN